MTNHCSATGLVCSHTATAARFLLLFAGFSQGFDFNVAYASDAQTINSNATSDGTARRLNPTGRTLELDSPIQLNSQIIGSLVLTMDADDTLSVSAPDLLTLLKPRVDQEIIDTLSASANDDKISVELLEEAGVDVMFDTSRLTLVLGMPESMLLQQVVSLRGVGADRSDVASPETASGFINMRVRGSYLQSDDNWRVQWRADTDGMLRLGRPVLDFEGSLEEGSDGDQRWIRRGTRVLYDLPSIESRATFGDVFSIGQSFQSTLDLLGIRFGREYQLVPGRNIRPLGRQQFTLSERSLVSVIADGLTIRRLELEPGRYDLRDIPLAAGDNTIELLVESETGSVERLEFSSLFDFGLLDIGEIDYGVAAGILAERTGGSPEYMTDERAASAYASTGVRPWLTAGINVQHAMHATLFGAQFLSASAIGPFRLDMAASDNRFSQNGWAAIVGYQSISLGQQRGFRTSFDVEYRSAFFDDVDGQPDILQLSDTQLSQGTAYSASTATTMQWSSYLTGTLGLRYSSLHGDSQSAQSLFGALSGRIQSLQRWSWSTRVQWLQGGGKQSEFGAFLGLVYRPSRVDTHYSSYESKDNEVELGFRRRVDANQLGGYFAEVDVNSNRLGEQRAKFNAGYSGNRFRALADHTNSKSGNSANDTSSSLTSVQFESSLAFAGSRLGFGRPITDSFALIDGHKTLEGREIRINPTDESSIARNSWLGAAVVPGLGRYSLKTLNYTVDDLPLGYDLGAGVFAVKPPEGAGYRLTVGSAAIITVIGVLMDAASNEPFSLVTGKVLDIDDTTREPIVIFTNRKGKFAISGIAPGRYNLVLDGLSRSVELDVPDDGSTLLRLGSVAVD